MKTKRDYAHEYAVEMLKRGDPESRIALDAWKLADAMQAEADKRVVKGVPEVIQSLTKDKDGNCLHFHHEFGHKKCMDCGASLEQWQPDWSQAPDYCHFFCVAFNGGYGFFTDIYPELMDDYFYVGCGGLMIEDHGYTGNWQDSLRERP